MGKIRKFFLFLFIFFVSCIINVDANDKVYSEEIANEWFVVQENILQIDSKQRFFYNDLTKTEDSILVVGYLEAENNLKIPYLVCFKNGMIKFKKQYDEFENGEFKSCLYYDGYYYIVGSYNLNDIEKPFLYKIDENGGSFYNKLLSCDGETSVIDLYVYEDILYVFFNSYGDVIGKYKIDYALCSFFCV